MKKKYLITIDGPAGAGKTTVSKMLARHLGYRYLDTGALYRAVAWSARADNVSPDDDLGLKILCDALELDMSQDRMIAGGVDITDQIRSPEITMMASAVSARPVVRQALLGIQRDLGKQKALVAEGRDMGTVVFPLADVKFFLNASVTQRALRRFEQYGKAGAQTLEQIEADIRRRDDDDSSRDIAPLRAAEDALTIDSTTITARQVVDRMLDVIGALEK